jgi:hypothetical protein
VYAKDPFSGMAADSQKIGRMNIESLLIWKDFFFFFINQMIDDYSVIIKMIDSSLALR